MSDSKDLIKAFLAHGGEIKKCPAAHPDNEPMRKGQIRALQERQGRDTNWTFRGRV